MFFSFLIEIISKFFGLFGYISNDRLYPEPLSKTEEEYYLRKYFDGDKEARKILIEHNLRLVVHIAKQYKGIGMTIEGYRQGIGTFPQLPRQGSGQRTIPFVPYCRPWRMPQS